MTTSNGNTVSEGTTGSEHGIGTIAHSDPRYLCILVSAFAPTLTRWEIVSPLASPNQCRGPMEARFRPAQRQ